MSKSLKSLANQLAGHLAWRIAYARLLLIVPIQPVLAQQRNTSATLQAWAAQPRGV